MSTNQTPVQLIRQSERGDFKSCPQKWEWRWNQGLVLKWPKQDALWFGTLWHLLWATVYTPVNNNGFERSIVKPSEIHQLWDELTKGSYTSVSGQPYWGDDDELEFNDACALGHLMIDGQLKEWNLDPGWEVLQPEQRFRMNIPYTARQRNARLDRSFMGDVMPHIATVVGTYDLPVRDHNDPGVPQPKMVDWKTSSRRTNPKDLNKDDQTGTYLLTGTLSLRALGLLKPTESLEYMIFSFARKAKPPEQTKLVDEQGRIRNKPQKNHYLLDFNKRGINEFTEKDSLKTLESFASQAGITVYGEVSKNQGSPLFWRDVVRRNKANKARQLIHIADEAEVMQKIRNGELPITKSPGEHCNWCPFNDLCDVDEDGGDTESFIKDMYKYEDPYMDHRKGAVNSKELKK